MNREEMLKTIENMSNSRGFYGRLLERLREMKEDVPEEYENLMQEWESHNFASELDFILYLEE